MNATDGGDLRSLSKARSSDDGEAGDWPRVKAIFLKALDHPEAERAAVVSSASGGDTDLAQEVMSLLASGIAAGEFCETPAVRLLSFESGDEEEERAPFAAGTVLGPYTIRAFLCAGGMGEIYRADHTLLHREVAIKTVRGRATRSAANRRLMAEARHASRLSHPNICTIYEVGEQEDIPFIAMQFVDGTQLRELIRTSPPSLDEALRLGIEIADALGHAHRHGIVHRDLKSSNVVVERDGRPVVLDFGISRRLPGIGDLGEETTATAGGTLAGTLSHMAPEVLRGEPADVRSDIWSLGVLLYEIVTGTLPFQGATPFETSRRIMSSPPEPINRSVPLPLRLVIDRCLAKDTRHRYQSAREVGEALAAIRRHNSWRMAGALLLRARKRALYLAAGLIVVGAAIGMAAVRLGRWVPPGTRAVSAIGVVPFENATGDAGADYYARGLTDALTTQLGRTGRVNIVHQLANFAGSAEQNGTLRKNLDALLEGRLVKMGDRVAVDVRLVAGKNGRIMWSDRFERSASQVLALQADVIRSVAAELRLGLIDSGRNWSGTVRAVNPDAYEQYLKGVYEWNKRSPEALLLAVQYFRRAIELDPTYAPPHAAVADCYNQFGTVMVGMGSPLVYRPKAIAEAIAALRIDPYSAEGHATLGYAYHYDWRWNEAERELKTAIALNPSYALAHVWYANLLMSRKRLKEGLQHVYMARALDPYSMIVNSNVAWLLLASGRRSEAISVLRWALQVDSTYIQARWRLAFALADEGQLREAERHAERLVELSDSTPSSLAVLAHMQYLAGRKDSARAILATLEERSRHEYVVPASMAGLHAMFGDSVKRVAWLRLAFRERSNAMAYNDFSAPIWKSDRTLAEMLERSQAMRDRYATLPEDSTPPGSPAK